MICYLLLWVICAFAVGGKRGTYLKKKKKVQQRGAKAMRHGERALTHGAFPHQTDELMRPRLSSHPQEDFSEWAVGEPAILWGWRDISVNVHGV